jgi:two-component system response regulator FlrC
LYYRLNVFPITVPPLRERPSDIGYLAVHFAKTAAARNGLAVAGVTDAAQSVLQRRPWKGNVRELENVMERAVLLAAGGPILPEHIPSDEASAPTVVPAAPSVPAPTIGSGNGSLWEMERELIFQTLARTKDNRTHAAKELGISIRTLRNKLKEYRQHERPAVGQI